VAILVTGGAGFIGSHLCDRLLKNGEEVICVDDLNSYYSAKRKIKNIQHNLDNKLFHLYALNITDGKELNTIFKRFRITKIVHLAARAGVRASIQEPGIYVDANVLGTLNLLELAKTYKVDHFIFGSSSSVYGENKKAPFNENDRVDFPISPYATSKRAAELYCQTYSKLYKINITCLRFFTVYGPRGRPDMAPYMFSVNIFNGKPIKMFGDGSSKRDYTYVSDIIDGIIGALNRKLRFEIINLGNSNTLSLKEFISTIENVVGKKAVIKKCPMQMGDVPLTFADVSKGNRLIGYEPKVKFKDGINLFWEWYKNEK
jgi:UDP-glucuronate 4-epimerase